jgi:hypothetical protein
MALLDPQSGGPSRGGVLLTELYQRLSQECHRPPGIEDFLS